MSSKQKIAQGTVDEIERKIVSLAQGRWTLQILELQEDATCLFVLLDLSQECALERVSRDLELLRHFIEARVAPKWGSVSWLIAIRQNGEVISSYQAEILRKLGSE